MRMSDWKKKIQESWLETPRGWDKHVQNVYVTWFALHHKKINNDTRSRHWRQYLNSDSPSTEETE